MHVSDGLSPSTGYPAKPTKMNKLNVLITIDTEHSIGGAFKDPRLKPVGNDKRVYGRINGKEYGIPLIMDIAEANGLTLTFFVEVLNKFYFGEDETRQVCAYILQRGHDVQLHLHPNFLNFKEKDPWRCKYQDNMHAYSRDEQVAILSLGKDILSSYTGRNPVAFRAGNYGADSNTLLALAETGFLMDSSYNRAFHRAGRINLAENFNDIGKVGDIYEVPVTNFIQKGFLGGKRFRPLDINGVDFEEIRHVLEQSQHSRMPAATIVIHSFSFIRAHDPQYKTCSLRHNVIKRYSKICSYLQQNNDRFQTTTMQEFGNMINGKTFSNSCEKLPTVPLKLSLARMVNQVWNELFSGKKFIS
jgi:hypothetical protein